MDKCLNCDALQSRLAEFERMRESLDMTEVENIELKEKLAAEQEQATQQLADMLELKMKLEAAEAECENLQARQEQDNKAIMYNANRFNDALQWSERLDTELAHKCMCYPNGDERSKRNPCAVCLLRADFEAWKKERGV